ELARRIAAPACERFGRRGPGVGRQADDRAGVIATRGNRPSDASGTKIDWRKAVHLLLGCASRIGVPETELPVGVGAPTLDRAIVEQRTRMIEAQRNGLRSAAST